MTTLLEEKWEARSHCIASNGLLPEEDDLATFWGPCVDGEKRALLASAAPEMARALLALHKSITFEERTAARIMGDEALKKAGVLP